MAVIEQNGLLSYIDAAGNTYILYPVTKLDNVDGAEDLLKTVAQQLTDAQKTQARGNIGAAASSHSHTKSEITDFPTTMAPSSHKHTKSDISDFSHSHTKNEISDFPSSMAPIAHKASHAINGADAISPADIGAKAKPTTVTGSGAITVTLADNKDYVYTDVTSLSMTGAAVECHGFVTFGSSAPSVTVSGFTASGGDDITSAAAGQVWEFSVFPHNSGSYIIWKNWSA